MVITFLSSFCMYIWRYDGFGVELKEVSRCFLAFKEKSEDEEEK